MQILPFLPPTLPRRIRRIVLLSFARPVRLQGISAWSARQVKTAWPDVSKRPESAWTMAVQYPRERKPLVGPMITILLDKEFLSIF